MADKEKKVCIKHIKEYTKTYNDGTVVVEVKEVSDGASVMLEKKVTQDKLTRKKSDEMVIVKETVSSTFHYDDGSKLNQTKEYDFDENLKKVLVRDLVTTFK